MPSTFNLSDVFSNLTGKQKETITLLAEGFTSKEIASILQVSESAVVQRIETMRNKTGGLLRKELVREYRQYLSEQETDTDQPGCNELTGKIFHLQDVDECADREPRQHPQGEMELSDSMEFIVTSPWANDLQPKVVPEVLDGRNAGLNRWLAACGLAVSISAVMLVLLSVAGELAALI
ncbi:helix-turn-helix transcriptional regulator [Aurantiacibacter zhengii]|uniref:Helix-turn-helix transcriptional regulator n=1 Tax=Aurantiacibacter zhengii TaxID=2307003 RepID=A0A418NX79_9SPHN|nr:helix-turn-helix transcriptional regulator [Aurantiacibacter zhengii]RIV89217.1 helix-turn-helix transcriptional regulator [Aurantiacibacter zhengii]